ncbi:hypothetical protein COB52_03765 [Candidatus Kaiserbacteria bacterium]|nr:MAG: hypothetical protein COB52_03765 [Candidatus Kaiserbacteria bacterium]
MPAEYAQALHNSLETSETPVESLVQILKREGKLKALPAILKEFQRIEERTSSQKPTVYVAKEEDIEKVSMQFDAEVLIDESLIGGFRYVDKDTLIDSSYKAALLKLYRKITK